jgi:hypothetical protein
MIRRHDLMICIGQKARICNIGLQSCDRRSKGFVKNVVSKYPLETFALELLDEVLLVSEKIFWSAIVPSNSVSPTHCRH